MLASFSGHYVPDFILQPIFLHGYKINLKWLGNKASYELSTYRKTSNFVLRVSTNRTCMDVKMVSNELLLV